MSTDDPELVRLRAVAKRARALRDRLRADHGFLSDPVIVDRAEELDREAREAVEAHMARRGSVG